MSTLTAILFTLLFVISILNLVLIAIVFLNMTQKITLITTMLANALATDFDPQGLLDE